jgi:hypothetical protein
VQKKSLKEDFFSNLFSRAEEAEEEGTRALARV